MKLEILKFYADWCGPCRVLSQRLEGEKNIKEINIEKDHETSIKYKVRNIPTLVFLNDGEEVHRSTGLITKHEYELILDKFKVDQEIDNTKANDLDVIEPEIVTELKKEK